jgi:hypothetical protein
VFQGGVAANVGIKTAFEKALGMPVIIPEYSNIMGAIGAAQLAKEKTAGGNNTSFKGFDVTGLPYRTGSFDCNGCSNVCEIVEIYEEEKVIGRWGSRCAKWVVV